MYDFPDHPVIANMEATGYPDGLDPDYPHCPACDRECSEVYLDADGEIIGCDRCIRKESAWERDECFPEGDYE